MALPVARRRVPMFAVLCLVSLCLLLAGQAWGQAPGGWVEKDGSGVRSRYSASQIRSFVPAQRGAFTFPAPYLTRGVRLTDASDCAGGADCLWYVGYSYWRNMNNHVGSNDILIFLSFSTDRGGSGATLFKYNKATDAVTKVGPLFPAGSKFSAHHTVGWYFSASLPTKMYLNDGPRMLRYDVATKQFETIYDVTALFGANRSIQQMHTSNDDLAHSATLAATSTGESLGCLVYLESSRQFRFYPKVGTFDECNLDKSGRWTISLENLGVPNDTGMRIFDNQTGKETRIAGPGGTLAHLDMGYGYAVGADGFNALPNATILWSFAPSILEGPVVHYNVNWNVANVNHLSHLNARPNTPLSQQFACGSNVSTYSAQDEIACFRLDTSDQQLVVAPVMTDMNAPGGCCDSYAKYPKGNLDITGQYFLWTSNMGGSRLDAFLVKVPSHLLVGSSGAATPPPAPAPAGSPPVPSSPPAAPPSAAPVNIRIIP